MGTMSTNELSIRLRGELPSSEDLTNILGVSPSFTRRRGTPIRRGKGIQPVDVWGITLIERDRWTQSRPESAALAYAIAELARLSPLLYVIDRAHCSIELYISSIRDTEQGGFELPAELITVAGQTRLDLVVSILCDPDDNGDSGEDSGEDNGLATAQVQ